MLRNSVAFVCVLSVILSACSVDNENDPGYQVLNDESLLNQRLEVKDVQVEVESLSTELQKISPPSFNLKLVAEVDPSIINGHQIQATMVSIFGNSGRAAVSYNVRGSDYVGAVDVLQISGGKKENILIKSSVEFTNAKVNAVHIGNSDLFVALASDDPSLTNEEGYSAAGKFNVSGFKIDEIAEHSGLPGYAANSIIESNSSVYVTSGTNAGLTIFEADFSEKKGYLEFSDSRWVDADGNRIVILGSNTESGNGTLYVLDKNMFEIVNEFPFEGADIPEAKNTVELKGDLALIAAGRSGTHFMDITTGEILATIPIPDPETLGLTPDVVQTNAVSADDEFIFISNGEAGVYAAEANMDLNQYESGQNLSVELVGHLKFDDLQSVNHIAYRNNSLIVAAGLGGVKVVSLSRK